MLNNTNIKGFIIETNRIPEDVIERKCETLSKRKKTSLRKEFGSEYNFITLLFHLKFIEKLENKEIYKAIGYKNPASVQHLLYSLGWSYSFDFDENCQMFQEDLVKIQFLLEEAKKKSVHLDIRDPQHKKLKKALEKARKLKKKCTKS